MPELAIEMSPAERDAAHLNNRGHVRRQKIGNECTAPTHPLWSRRSALLIKIIKIRKIPQMRPSGGIITSGGGEAVKNWENSEPFKPVAAGGVKDKPA